MPSLRSQLATELKALLPTTVKIVDVPRGLDGIEAKRPVVMLYRTSVQKAPNGIGTLFNTFSLWIVSPNVDPKRSEDQLDEMLDTVLTALLSISWLKWTQAVRSTFGDQQAPAYEITLEVISKP